MKQTIEINVPEGFKAVWNENTQQIDLVKIDNRPRSWEEFCAVHRAIKYGEAFIDNRSNIVVTDDDNIFCDLRNNENKNWCTSKEEAKAFLALMQLRQLRKVWVGNWEPDWKAADIKYILEYYNCCIQIFPYSNTSRCLSFPTEQMTKEFLECFRDLIETAKILL